MNNDINERQDENDGNERRNMNDENDREIMILMKMMNNEEMIMKMSERIMK